MGRKVFPKKSKSKLRFYAIQFLIFASITSLPAKGQILYDVIDLGRLPESFVLLPWGINNDGQVVGESVTFSIDSYGVLFDSSGGGNVIDLGGDGSYAIAINNNGQIVGGINDASGSWLALFDPSGSGDNTLIYFNGVARSINDSGIIAGWVETDDYDRAAVFDAAHPSTYTDLGSLPGLDGSGALSINNNFEIVGYAYDSSSQLLWDTRAVLFDYINPQSNIDLGSLPGYGAATAFSINDSGQIVGRANYQDAYLPDNFVPRAVLFDPSGAGDNVDLGLIDGIGGAEALSINNNGQIVGRAIERTFSVYKSTAVLFNPTGNGDNLNLNGLINPDLGYNLTTAIAINDNGWIACWASNQDYQSCAVLLTPIPEPATLLLFGLGSLTILCRRKV